MTTPMNKADDGVHRLVDMVVEEVSLVDRAANKHRFLIVKRDDAMDDDNTTDTTTTDPSPSAAPTAKLDDGTALGAALTAPSPTPRWSTYPPRWPRSCAPLPSSSSPAAPGTTRTSRHAPRATPRRSPRSRAPSPAT